MKKDGYIETEVVAALSKKGVKFTGRVAEIRSGSLGINTLGKVDFLENHCKYQIRFIGNKDK